MFPELPGVGTFFLSQARQAVDLLRQQDMRQLQEQIATRRKKEADQCWRVATPPFSIKLVDFCLHPGGVTGFCLDTEKGGVSILQWDFASDQFLLAGVADWLLNRDQKRKVKSDPWPAVSSTLVWKEEARDEKRRRLGNILEQHRQVKGKGEKQLIAEGGHRPIFFANHI